MRRMCLANGYEESIGTRWNKADTDRDGWSDWYEVVYGGDPLRSSAALGQLGVDAIVARTVEAIRRDTAGR